MTVDMNRRANAQLADRSRAQRQAASGGARMPTPSISESSRQQDALANQRFEAQAAELLLPTLERPALITAEEINAIRAKYSTGDGRFDVLKKTTNPRLDWWLEQKSGTRPFDPLTPAQAAEAAKFFEMFGARLSDQPRQAPPNPLRKEPAPAPAAAASTPHPPLGNAGAGQAQRAAANPQPPQPAQAAAHPPAGSFTDDADLVDPSTVETPPQLYPMAQWLHGDPKLAAAGGIAHTGGVILPVKYLADDVPPAAGWTRASVAFGSGKSELVLAAAKPALAVVRTRFRWFTNRGGATTYYPRADYKADMGMRGHLQVLCAVYGYSFPIVVTFKGKASQVLETLLREFAARINEAVGKLPRPASGKPAQYPRFAWYMKLQPGAPVKVGQKGQESVITPPEAGYPTVMDQDYLGKIYVGRERLLELQGLYHQAGDWAILWNNSAAVAAGDPGSDPDDAGDVDAF